MEQQIPQYVKQLLLGKNKDWFRELSPTATMKRGNIIKPPITCLGGDKCL